MSDDALEVTNLFKSYGDFTAVKDVSFVVPRGSVIGLLGPNGAGKTTTIQMLMGITEPTAGTIRYFGEDFAKHRRSCLQRINYTSAYNELMGSISVRENLTVFAHLYGLRKPQAKIADLVEYFEITALLDKKFYHLSAGQKTRVNIAKALLNDPELVMMDEPTASLDPDIRDKVMSLIETTREQRELSILFTSHNMDEVTRICDEVILLDRGSIIRHDTPARLASEVHRPAVSIHFRGSSDIVVAHLGRQGSKVTLESHGHVTVEADPAHIPGIIGTLDGLTDITITDIDIRKPSLEDAFLHFARGGGEAESDARGGGEAETGARGGGEAETGARGGGAESGAHESGDPHNGEDAS